MTKKKGHLEVIERIYKDIPSFTEIFTEDSFYVFAIIFVLSTVLIAFVLSRFITIKPVDM